MDPKHNSNGDPKYKAVIRAIRYKKRMTDSCLYKTLAMRVRSNDPNVMFQSQEPDMPVIVSCKSLQKPSRKDEITELKKDSVPSQFIKISSSKNNRPETIKLPLERRSGRIANLPQPALAQPTWVNNKKMIRIAQKPTVMISIGGPRPAPVKDSPVLLSKLLRKQDSIRKASIQVRRDLK